MAKWNRRYFLKSAALGMVALGTAGAPPFLTRLVSRANAQAITSRRRTLVSIFQRGAMDGVMAVPPLDDPGLRALRPRLAMAPGSDGSPVDIGDGFGLHPGLGALLPMYEEGRLAIVHGVGSPNTTRSHFDAQDYMETGTPFRKGTPSGWLNRSLELVDAQGHPVSPFRAVSLTASMPRSLYGSEPALAVSDLKQFALRGPGRVPEGSSEAGFEALYEQTTSELLHDTGGGSFEAMETLQTLDVSGYRPAPGVDYPESPLGRALRQIAFLVKAQVGLEVAFAESGGWDTHVQQGTTRGAFANRAGDLSRSIAAFWTDLGSYRDDVVVMTMTEFGRTVHENGSGGTDHGRGSCLFVLGDDVRGGRVHGRIPRLRADELEDGRDLPVTTDFRAVFAEVAGRHLGASNEETLFPGWEGAPLPLWRG